MQKRKGKKVNSYKDKDLTEIVKTYESIADAERDIGVSSGSVNKSISLKCRCRGFYFGYANGHSKDEPVKEVAPVKDMYVTEDQLHARHDMGYRIMKEISAIPQGTYLEENMLLKKAGIAGKAGYRSAIDDPDLKQYRGKADGVTYYGHPENIEKLKMKGLLS